MASTSQETRLDHQLVQRWRGSWDALMRRFMPELASFEGAMAALAESACGGAPASVVDLGGGPGLLAERLSLRWPRADVGVVDLDPLLLALAEAGTPPGVTTHRGDLGTSRWIDAIARFCPADLISVVMTMHYLPESQARAIYHDARAVLRPGGLLIVADLMPNGDVPSLMNASYPVADEASAGLAWARWWEKAGAEAAFGPLLRQRQQVFAGRRPAEFTPDEQWHRATALAAGFREAGAVWRRGPYAAMCAVV